jgi:hypothetical protein
LLAPASLVLQVTSLVEGLLASGYAFTEYLLYLNVRRLRDDENKRNLPQGYSMFHYVLDGYSSSNGNPRKGVEGTIQQSREHTTAV